MSPETARARNRSHPHRASGRGRWFTIAIACIATLAATVTVLTLSSESAPATTLVTTIDPLTGDRPMAAAASPTLSVVPVALAQGTVGYTPTVQVSVAGSAPLTLLLDSGSAGLVLNTPDVPTVVIAKLTNLHATVDQDYTSGNVTGELYSGEMSILDAAGSTIGTWSTPLVIGECAKAGCGWPRAGIQGVLGIGNDLHTATGGDVTQTFASPFTGVDGMTGVAFHFDSTSMTGTLIAGNTASVTGTTLAAPSSQGTYANGLPAWKHYVSGCWVIESITSCDAYTTFDSGAPSGFISSTQFESLFGDTTRALPNGTVISLTAGANANPFGTLTTGRPNFALDSTPGLKSNPVSNNSGAGFLLDRDVAISYATGEVTIGTAGSNSVMATAQTLASASATPSPNVDRIWPQNLVVWMVPFAMILLALAIATVLFMHRRRDQL